MVVVDVLVLVLELLVGIAAPGHSAWIPMPNWKTPMMEVSLTSTSAQPETTASEILTSPWTHAELQVAAGLKSSATQPSILEL